MASASVQDQIFTEQVTHLYEGVPLAVIFNVVNATILSVMLYETANPLHVSLWGAALVALIVARSILYIAFYKRSCKTGTCAGWSNAMIGIVALFGLLWGAAAWVFMPVGEVQYQLLTAMILFVLAIGSMSNLYPVWGAYLAFVGPMVLLLLARFVMIGTELHFAMAVSGGMLLVFMAMFAKRQRDELVKTLMLRIENRDLLERLERENEQVRRENEKMTHMEALLRKKSAVLDAVSQVQGLFIADRNPAAIFDETLSTILRLTGSGFGFIGEVLADKNGTRYLKTFSVTDISWNEEVKNFYDKTTPVGIEFRNHQSLLGQVLRTGEPIISNCPAIDPRSGGLPEGHPVLRSFMGVPLYMGEKMVGMLGLANRPKGYTDDLLISLDPVINAAAGMVEALQNRRDRVQAQDDAASAMQRLTTAIESLNDGFVIYDKDDRLVLCNSKYREFYNETADLMVPGTTFEKIVRTGVERGQYEHGANVEEREEWIQNRLAIHHLKESLMEQKLANGTWLRVEDRETPDGGRVGFRVDITELKRTQEELQKAMFEGERSSKAKTEFLSSMSHELRTPMNAVLGFAQLLQMNPQVPLHPKQKDAVNQIIKAGNHLLELINEILDLSRIEAGRVNLSIENVDPCGAVEECLAYIAPLADKRSITINASVPKKHDFSIRTDHTRFKQVLLNLLSNAVKYNVENGQVALTVHLLDENRVRFCISDTGLGIPEDKQNELFHPFSRLGAETTDVEGTGIGLTITRKLAELMGGRLDFESVPGKGSSFWVDLPGSVGSIAVQQEKSWSEPSLPIMPDGHHRVLYIEDNPDNLILMQYVIAMVDGVEMISAHTGELGVEIAEIHRPDVIMMDINLPGINGIEALKRLRAMEKTKDIPVVAVSADVMPADIKIAMQAGFDAYLTKPINLVETIEFIKMAIEGKLVP
ncbi:MAG: ATP-binding protein [Rhodospirillales bacterium]|nr:ATP-binding protein [Rhodospirillales bacterium]